MIRRAEMHSTALTGGLGLLASIITSHWSEAAAALAAVATAAYMSLRAAHEWVSLRQALRSKELHDENKKSK